MSETRRRALVTGITGQDGGHLAELLHEKGYEVFGLIRGQNNPRRRVWRPSSPTCTLIEGDLTDPTSLVRAVEIADPDEVYNLGGDQPRRATRSRTPHSPPTSPAKGVLNLLEAVRRHGPRRAHPHLPGVDV